MFYYKFFLKITLETNPLSGEQFPEPLFKRRSHSLRFQFSRHLLKNLGGSTQPCL